MLDRIILFSTKNKLIISLFTLALIAWGGYSVTQLPIDAVPDITNNQVQVITVAPSQSALDIERLVTFPVEQNVATIPGIEEVRSFSRFGLSVVTIVFKDNIDVYWARQQVNERLMEIQSQIPVGVGSPKLAPVTTGLGEIYQYALHALPSGSVVPWHRVINAKGEISPRKRGGGELTQRALLEQEGVHFSWRGRVDLTTYGWDPGRR